MQDAAFSENNQHGEMVDREYVLLRVLPHIGD
jgi:hypothetical protein